MRSPRTLIIGYGNLLRGDDALGWEIARLAGAEVGASAQVLTQHQLMPELADPISKADLVVFIDASHEGQPGSWTCKRIDLEIPSSPASTHHFTPVALLAYSLAIFNARPRALLVAVAGESFECGQELSGPVRAALPEIARQIHQEIINTTQPEMEISHA